MPKDKLLHLLVGLILAALAWQGGPWACLALPAVVGILKECWDSQHPDTHTADPWDAAATAAGGILLALFRLLAAS